MKLWTVLSRAYNVLGYLQRRRRMKLYQQWVERASLPPEAIPQEKVTEDMIPKIEKRQLRLPLLYMLFGASLLILCMGLILLIIYSC